MLAQSGPTVWVAPSLHRVGRSEASGASTQAQLSAGRGEYESFQIVVRGPAGVNLTNLNVSVSDLTSSSGPTIAKSNVTLFREQYVYVESASPNCGGRGGPDRQVWIECDQHGILERRRRFDLPDVSGANGCTIPERRSERAEKSLSVQLLGRRGG